MTPYILKVRMIPQGREIEGVESTLYLSLDELPKDKIVEYSGRYYTVLSAEVDAETQRRELVKDICPDYDSTIWHGSFKSMVRDDHCRPADSHSSAKEILNKAIKAMEQRSQLRDNPDGERSMARTIEAFNAITGRELTEREGWMFMILLKMVRGFQGKYHEDDYVDGAAYFGLLGECEW